MRRVLNNSDLRIDRKTYYNLIRGKLFNEYSSDSFEGLVLALEEVGFKFACLMSDDLADNNSTQGRMLERVFFLLIAKLLTQSALSPVKSSSLTVPSRRVDYRYRQELPYGV